MCRSAPRWPKAPRTSSTEAPGRCRSRPTLHHAPSQAPARGIVGRVSAVTATRFRSSSLCAPLDDANSPSRSSRGLVRRRPVSGALRLAGPRRPFGLLGQCLGRCLRAYLPRPSSRARHCRRHHPCHRRRLGHRRRRRVRRCRRGDVQQDRADARSLAVRVAARIEAPHRDCRSCPAPSPGWGANRRGPAVEPATLCEFAPARQGVGTRTRSRSSSPARSQNGPAGVRRTRSCRRGRPGRSPWAAPTV